MTPKVSTLPGIVVWITGLSGAGKTTIGRCVFTKFRCDNPNTLFVDGDSVRNIVGDDLGYTREDRLINAQRVSRMCQHFADQGLHVICSTMSLFPEIWNWNRAHMSGYFEVYLRASTKTLAARDTRGTYHQDRANVIGADLPFVEPLGADLVIDTSEDGRASIDRNVVILLQAIKEHCANLKLSNERLITE